MLNPEEPPLSKIIFSARSLLLIILIAVSFAILRIGFTKNQTKIKTEPINLKNYLIYEKQKQQFPQGVPVAPPASTETSTAVNSNFITPAPLPVSTSGCEQWRFLVQKYFGASTDDALRIMDAESGGNIRAYNVSGCYGLFQIASCHLRDNPDSLFEPEVNVKMAFDIWNGDGNSWREWTTAGPLGLN